jgi:transcriptional regulator with XRE-family HTH domain
MPTEPETFGANVRAARTAKDWTQEDLAHATGLAVVQVSRIERGVREVRLTTIARLAKALDVTPNDLLRGLY